MINISFFDGFTIVNFFYLASIIGYLSYRYLIPSLSDSRAKDEKMTKSLKQEYHRLVREKESVEREREAQNKQGIWLLERIKDWNKIVVEKEKQQEKNLHHSQKVMKNYLEEQAQNLSLQHIKDEVAPEALEHTEQQLKKLFEDKKQQEAFLEKALTTLRRQAT